MKRKRPDIEPSGFTVECGYVTPYLVRDAGREPIAAFHTLDEARKRRRRGSWGRNFPAALDNRGCRTEVEAKGEFMVTKKAKERAVVVTTEHRGVFFGYATDTDGATIKLRAARNCIYWPSENHGFLGLASDGPAKGARVGPAADIELRAITCVAECTPTSVKQWEAGLWA